MTLKESYLLTLHEGIFKLTLKRKLPNNADKNKTIIKHFFSQKLLAITLSVQQLTDDIKITSS